MLANADLERYRLTGGTAGEDILDAALTHARTAATLAPQSARSMQVLSDVLAAGGDVAGADQAIARASELNPYSLDVLQSAGFRRIEQGDYEKGMAILSEVSQAGAPDNPWRSLLLAVAMAHLNHAGDRFAGLSDPLPHPAALLSTLVAKGAQAQISASRAASVRLSQSFPDVAKDPTGFLRRANLQQNASAMVLEHLKAANEPKS